MAIEYLTGLNAIVMKAIWNIEKRQGRVIIQDLVEEIKRNTGKEYHRNSVSTYLRRLEKKDFIETKKEEVLFIRKLMNQIIIKCSLSR